MRLLNVRDGIRTAEDLAMFFKQESAYINGYIRANDKTFFLPEWLLENLDSPLTSLYVSNDNVDVPSDGFPIRLEFLRESATGLSIKLFTLRNTQCICHSKKRLMFGIQRTVGAGFARILSLSQARRIVTFAENGSTLRQLVRWDYSRRLLDGRKPETWPPQEGNKAIGLLPYHYPATGLTLHLGMFRAISRTIPQPLLPRGRRSEDTA
ncbi:hypothetical protein MKZ38_001719 [Zalerion maritima]|uniref:Uncharacterized protein n=1 Tax=Zalerion maritima TaxID=339359 RepID=A0AAD5RXN4_9PEZI|nr:hypothetical protein MKZ38_001719 [Zalerion maritima]